MLFVFSALILGGAFLHERKQRSQIEAARNAHHFGRKANNLFSALSVVPRGYIPAPM